jgi:hypothetical protein
MLPAIARSCSIASRRSRRLDAFGEHNELRRVTEPEHRPNNGGAGAFALTDSVDIDAG